jgi:hypothetical protein
MWLTIGKIIQDIKLIYYYRIYKTILGSCLKQNLDFKEVLLHKFAHKKLVDLLEMVKD